MTKNPILNSIAAFLYILFVAGIIFWVGKIGDDKLTFIGPVAGISLFTLSASVMGYIFLSQPLQLYLDNKKKQGINLFLKTVASFAVITSLIFALVVLMAG